MKWNFLLVGAFAVTALIGCNGGESASKPTSSTSEGTADKPAGSFKVALLTLDKVSDSGWNAMAYGGLQAVKKDLNADVSNKVSAGTQMKEDMRSYAQQGYNLVIGHAFEYNHPAMEVAKDFPKTIFVSSSGGETAANVGAFRFYLEEGFYLAGMMAGKMSKTGTIAEVGGVPNIPSIESTFAAFEAGAKSVRPNIIIRKAYAGSFTDAPAAQKATESVIALGADFVIHQANAAAQGVFNAAKAKGIYAFGANANQNDNDSGAVIASATIIADPAFIALAKEVQAGTYKGTIESFGMDKGAIDFVISPKLKDKVPAELQKLIEDTKAAIKSGKVDVPKAKF